MQKKKILVIIICILLVISIGFDVYVICFDGAALFYKLDWLQSEDFVQNTVEGILANELEFADGKDIDIEYDFANEEYTVLLEKYPIKKIAGNGTEFEQAKNLIHEYAGRIKHNCNEAVEPENMNALYLLDKYLDNKKSGTYCRAKAQIYNEMFLALGIYSRKVWILPLSKYDDECHVVNEVWDSSYNKWIMFDSTNDYYWVDENKMPLSVLEIREKLAKQEFCTPVEPGDDLSNLKKSLEKNKYNYVYTAKNLAYVEYLDKYTVGETVRYILAPENSNIETEYMISKESVEASPIR